MTYERFYFAVERWEYRHFLRTIREPSLRRNFGPANETTVMELREPLVSNTKRAAKRAELSIWPKGHEPSDWPDDLEAVGSVSSIDDGTMMMGFWVTPRVFQNLLVLATAGRVTEFSAAVENLRRGRGKIVSMAISTERTPAEELECGVWREPGS